ncbi:uncharacterized protein BDV14DRAFT_172333 [Aspergillus stella-maris]|uniref:uncharacterized protein n=1 Tax=Aspergillus stella-maris TaxID=1810926 RepID=UPI003CCE3989
MARLVPSTTAGLQIAFALQRNSVPRITEQGFTEGGLRNVSVPRHFSTFALPATFFRAERRKPEAKSGSSQSQESWKPIICLLLTPPTSSACLEGVSVV